MYEMLVEPIVDVQPSNPDPSLINEDFAPVSSKDRSFSTWDLAALWIGLVVCVPSYTLVGSLIDLGMSWWQGLITILVANIIVLFPMVLNGHPGTKYGVPFPVLARASFGIRGANVPSMLRALVACGWFGIQTWVGGGAIFTLANSVLGGALSTGALPFLGVSLGELVSFYLFWAVQVYIIMRGIESIKIVEQYSAPVLIVLSIALFAWAVSTAGGLGPMLSTPSQFGLGMPKEGQFWAVFLPSLTANVGFWATLSLNIPDFTRYAYSQKAQLMGQALGLPVTMVAFSFLALVVTSSTVVIFGSPISDPVAVLAKVGGPVSTFLALVGLIVATLSTNIAANVVAPANAFVNLAPQKFNFKSGGLLTATIGALMCPWNLIGSTGGYIFVWLVGYSALLGPVAGILLCDYFLLRKRELDMTGLFSNDPSGPYYYENGYNKAALLAFALGVAPNVPGFLQVAGILSSVPAFFSTIYNYAWFVGFGVSSLLYMIMMRQQKTGAAAATTA